tara:strand:+ start:385 stop:1098 length:714 start_codon:yes stop_codon:yes gene_type:complete
MKLWNQPINTFQNNQLSSYSKLLNVLITARAGSKRLPGKNLRNLCGKPLIAWSIEAAKKSRFINNIYVSTDSKEISEISKQYGAIVPRLRSKKLSEDNTSSFETAIDFIEYFDDETCEGEMLLIQPTSPLRFAKHIDDFILKVREKESRQCVAVRDVSKYFALANSEVKTSKNVFIPNGSMYYTKIDFLKQKRTFFSSCADLFIMDDFHSIDIDTQDDWDIAEACLKEILSRNNQII